MKIARVFPKRTTYTPKDQYVFIGEPPLFMPPIDEVHISVSFTWDLPEAERLARAWAHIAPVKVGGPATGMKGEDFTPGTYLKHGITITSRGCPNKCWFCSVWKRDGTIRELPITEGWIVQDDNLLACSDRHFFNVIDMLSKQNQRPQFMGLEAARLEQWQAEAIRSVNPETVFFAYDTEDDYEPLVRAIEYCRRAGFRTENAKHILRAYVLIGHPGDTIEKAEERLIDVMKLGILPMAMLWRNREGTYEKSWRPFQRIWARPALMVSRTKELLNAKAS